MFKCFKCGIQMASPQALKYHLNKKYSCKGTYCKFCNQTFSSRTNCINHIKECSLGSGLENLMDALSCTYASSDSSTYLVNEFTYDIMYTNESAMEVDNVLQLFSDDEMNWILEKFDSVDELNPVKFECKVHNKLQICSSYVLCYQGESYIIVNFK